MKHFIIMLKPVSALCNLRCKYCFYFDLATMRENPSFGRMQIQTVEKMLGHMDASLQEGDHVTFSFQGGEPTLAGLDFFIKFTQMVSRWYPSIRVSYTLQTNAVLLDDSWACFFSENHFLIGISLDILQNVHDDCRIDEHGRGTFKRVVSAMKLLDKYRVEYNVLCTLTDQLARHPQQVWRQICRLNVRYVQFTPCLGPLEEKGKNAYALTPERFASFYITLFSLWFADFQKGKYRSIKFFDDVIHLMAWGIPAACGINGACQPQIVVEADGSMYPCDFYCLDQYKIGNITENELSQLLMNDKHMAFLNRHRTEQAVCQNCAYQQFCGGNCRRMKNTICSKKDENFCGYRSFLKHCEKDLLRIACNEAARIKPIL